VTVSKLSEVESRVDFRVDRHFNIPINVDFYWQLKINDRVFMWPDADNNLRYVYSTDKMPETFVRENVQESIPAALDYMKVDGDYKIQLVLKVVKAQDPETMKAVSWADSVNSPVVEHTIGNVTKEE
jgi:hypothetical protein